MGLFCKRDLYERVYSAKVTYTFIDPTHRSDPIVDAAVREIEENCMCGVRSIY